MTVSKKVILLGHYGVGKSSLTRRFVHRKFSEQYSTTIGVAIEKKVVALEDQEVSMIIWDIAGESSHTKVPQSHKLGAHGVIYVIDLTRPDTYQELDTEIANLQKYLPNVPILVVGNKKDLFTEKDLCDLVKQLPLSPFALSSAKTGDSVDETFTELARQMV
uniref:GTP-binding protein n=1 Tax=Roseihalotalea indica TaxID=2867963 RepID=A0AA49JJ48_9BACT|nr:GTP-binding protein [Tunicatimonas sp. TK19036]